MVEEKEVISEVEYDEKNSLSESLPSLPETPPPELPTSPPPLIPILLPGEEASLPVSLLPPSSPSTLSHCPHPDLSTFLPPSFRLSNQRYSLPSSTYKSHSLDTSEVNQGAAAVLSSSEAESSTPDPTSGRSSPQSPQRVQLRHPKSQGPSRYRPERRSAFDVMLVSQPSAEDKAEKRLSVAERWTLALQAARRPDANTPPVPQQWKHTSFLTKGDQRPSGTT